MDLRFGDIELAFDENRGQNGNDNADDDHKDGHDDIDGMMAYIFCIICIYEQIECNLAFFRAIWLHFIYFANTNMFYI